jgi:hypothetical protein
MKLLAGAVLALTACPTIVQAFTPATILTGVRRPINQARQSLLWAATTEEIEAVSSMRAGEIKKELESYGVSTKSFLEKSELVDALVDARSKGMTSKEETAAPSSAPDTTSESSTTSTTGSTDSRPRDVRLQEEMENLKSMKATEMKKELEALGISTASFFEKPEFMKALAEARVDGVQNNTKKKKKRRGGTNSQGEGYAEYADVEVITDDSAGPRQKQTEAPSPGAGASPFGGAGGSPFGGGGAPGGMNMEDIMGAMGGMGGMGGMADMLKNMGGMGGGAGGASPFGGGAGGAPGGMGDMMGKAQEMMKNPKVMELMMKAQSNPKVMAAMQECMSNPAAINKYRNDPEVSELIKELEQYL